MNKIMRNISAFCRESIFGKMVITFLLIIFPIYGLSIGIYNGSIQTQRTDMSKTMLSQVNFYIENLDSEIYRIMKLQFSCVDDINLQQLSTTPYALNEFEKVQAIKAVQQRLLAISNSSNYIKNVKAYIPIMDRVICLSTVEKGIPMDEVYMLNVQSYTGNSPLIYWKEQIFMSVSHPIIKNNLPVFIIGIELDKKELENALQQFNNYEEGGSLMFNRKNEFYLARDDNTKISDEMLDFGKKAVEVSQMGTESVKIQKKPYLTIYTTSDYLGITFLKYVPEAEAFKLLKRYYNWLWIFTGTAFVLIIIYGIFTYMLIQKPLLLLVNSFSKMEKGNLNITIEHKHNDEFGYLYSRFNNMTANLNALIDQVYKQKILTQNAQLKQLQLQINPHFLYNSYYILNRMVILEDNENAARFSEQLGTYLKYITRNASDNVPLSSEVEHARIYAEIQTMRFSSRMKLEFREMPDEYKNMVVPRLIIQPIVENSFEHALEKKAQGGQLVIGFHKNEEALCITIEDNGNKLGDQELKALQRKLVNSNDISEMETTGVINVHSRIRYKFGEGSGLIFSRSELGGLKAVIRIELEKRRSDV